MLCTCLLCWDSIARLSNMVIEYLTVSTLKYYSLCPFQSFINWFFFLDQCIRPFGLYNPRCRNESKRSPKEASSCKGHELVLCCGLVLVTFVVLCSLCCMYVLKKVSSSHHID